MVSLAYDQLSVLLCQEKRMKRCHDYLHYPSDKGRNGGTAVTKTSSSSSTITAEKEGFCFFSSSPFSFSFSFGGGKENKPKKNEDNGDDSSTDNDWDSSSSSSSSSSCSSSPSTFPHERRSESVVSVINSECRKKMCKWFFEVAKSCEIEKDTVALSISYLDQYLCTRQGRSTTLGCKRTYQLTAMTALYIAVKIQENVLMGLDVFEKLSRGVYNIKDFEHMEKQIISALQWKMVLPTPHGFVVCFQIILLARTRLLANNNTITKGIDNTDNFDAMDLIDTVRSHADNVLCEYQFVTFLPSEIALIAIIRSINNATTTDRLKVLASDIMLELFSPSFKDDNAAGNKKYVNSLLRQMELRSPPLLELSEPIARSEDQSASATPTEAFEKRNKNASTNNTNHDTSSTLEINGNNNCVMTESPVSVRMKR